MNKQFPVVGALVVSFLVAYFLIGILLTGEIAPLVGVLFLVLFVWFLVYKSRHENLKNRELIVKMYDDLKGMLESVAEKERTAQEEARRRAAAKRERRERVERGRRTRPAKDPAVDKYADMIENKVREAEVRRHRREGTNRDPEEQ